MACLLPLVAEERAAGNGVDLGLRLSGGVGAEHGKVHAGVEVRCAHHGLVARRHARDDVALEDVIEHAGLPAQLAGQRSSPLRVGVVADPRAVLGRREAPRRPASVDAAADDPDSPGVLARELLRRHCSHGPRPKRGDSLRVHHRAHGAALGI